ncbi:MAG TPA: hypothetical protein VLF79_03145 [Candidatus Saccharimonadales bacterium]|nr:hypothetical protein [Candidatus Saccharimonadales bacterium]
MNNVAAIPNPALKPLNVLVGRWNTTGLHPFVPGKKLHGSVIFDWIEGGAFLRMQAEIDHPQFPTGLAIFGSDNASGQIFMLYFDEREISRKYEFSIKGNQWKWWRDHPNFSQRFTVNIKDNGNKMVSKGEMCRDGKKWEDDLSLTYIRIK